MSWFDSFFSYLGLIWQYFLNFVNTLLTFITALVGAVGFPALVAATVWGPIATCVIAVAGFAIVKIILGRSNV